MQPSVQVNKASSSAMVSTPPVSSNMSRQPLRPITNQIHEAGRLYPFSRDLTTSISLPGKGTPYGQDSLSYVPHNEVGGGKQPSSPTTTHPMFNLINEDHDLDLSPMELIFSAGNQSASFSSLNSLEQRLTAPNKCVKGSCPKCGRGRPPKIRLHGRGRRPFRFEAWWIHSDECGKVINEAWNSSSASDPKTKVYENLEECLVGLLNWSKLRFGDVPKWIKELEGELSALRSSEQLIDSKDVSLILSMPLSRYPCPDSLIWHYSNNRLFSVKSAYHVARSLATDGTPSRSSHPSGCWKFIWGAKLPHKIRVFIWRVCKGVLPTMSNLLRHHCLVENLCPCCSMHVETDVHVLLECDMARQVWSLSDLPWSIVAAWHGSVEDWIPRNRLVWNKESPDPLRIVINIKAFLLAFRKACSLSNTKVLSPFIPSHWSCPAAPCIKLNFDGATFNVEGGIGVGIIARNSSGECVGWLTSFYPHVESPEFAAALAAREELEFVIRKGWRIVTLEGDCGVVLSKINSPNTDYSSITSLISDIKLLSSLFNCISFSHVRRSCNCAAHALARSTTVSREGSGDPPSCVLSILCSDLVAE
ncbi:hypothetical protein BUALT_Bualt12G0076700 [Buddleja alternifolia]|uniref:Uncharacterized protein n=1 Tax=Buddleja alternifolia TaxID=168488 RepID=A0AAV6X037_9LAMI|nr:hypothetical protein BUALT_Bualt12G0076700 [Buddleja alternifolia]